MTNRMTTRKYSRKWLVLSAVATALLIIPRRSSRKSNNHITNKQDIKIDDADKNGSVESSDINDRRKSNKDSAIID